MFVTLDVSKLSGWLNADAPCRESKGGHTVRGGVRPGRRRTTAAQAACRRDSTADWGQGSGTSAPGDVRVEILRVEEEIAHVSDGRHAPVGDGAVRRSGRSR
eukprot:scaffold16283_cov58-Phaeocystis_antarctica.AAC.2